MYLRRTDWRVFSSWMVSCGDRGITLLRLHVERRQHGRSTRPCTCTNSTNSIGRPTVEKKREYRLIENVPALTIRGTPKNVIWAQGIFSIGIHNSKYFLGPKNSSWGSESRGRERAAKIAELDEVDVDKRSVGFDM